MEIGKGNGKIYLGIPRERFYFTEFVDNRDRILDSLQKDGLACGFFQASGHRVDINRDRICQGFLELTEKPEWLLMIDSDMEFVPSIGQRLAKYKKPIVGSLYFYRGDSHDPLVFHKAKSNKDRWGRPYRLWAPLRDEVYDFLAKANIPNYDGAIGVNGMDEADTLIECDAIGTGGILIHRSVLETVPGPWFEYEEGAISEDLAFCDKAKFEYQIPIYCDLSTISGHYKLSAMGHTQFRMKHEYRGIQASSYTAKDGKEWMAEFLHKSPRKIEKIFNTSEVNAFGEYWKTLGVDTVEKEREAYRDPNSAIPYMVELLQWNAGTGYSNMRKSYMNIRNSNVIDIGAGIGTMSIQMAVQHNNVISVEVNPVLRDFIKFRHEKIRSTTETQVYPLTLMGDEWFTEDIKNINYAFAIDVFEHMPLEDLKNTLHRLSEVMISGGQLIYHGNWGQQDLFPMHHNYGDIWKSLLLESGFYPISDTVAQRM